MINKIISYMKKKRCNHEYRVSDIKQLNHPAPVKPNNKHFEPWHEYYKKLDEYRQLDHVSCKCRKCGEIETKKYGLQFHKLIY